MLYRCTRNRHTSTVSFEECVLTGLSIDGGLLMPETIPRVTKSTLLSWTNFTYTDVVFEVAKLYIDPTEIPISDLKKLIGDAFKSDFLSDIIPIARLRRSGLSVAEMYHGPTMAFKDLSVACMGKFLEYFLKKRQKRATVIVATSGDTGGSVIHGLKSLESIDIVVMFPKGRCNEIQELQMTTATKKNVYCFEVEGTSDELDAVLSALFHDKDFVQKHNVTVANSINWARLMVQVANFFYMYLKSGVATGDRLHVVIPTGGAGNVCAACIAHRMGLPITVTTAVNENNGLHDALRDGHFRVPQEAATQTWASAMDIQIPWNLERIVHLFAEDTDTASLFKDLNDGKDIQIPKPILSQIQQVIVKSYCTNNCKIEETISRCYQEEGYLLCPHTATAMASFYDCGPVESVRETVCIATASPMKFPEALRAARVPYNEDDNYVLQKLRLQAVGHVERMRLGEDWNAILRQKIEDITDLNNKIRVS